LYLFFFILALFPFFLHCNGLFIPRGNGVKLTVEKEARQNPEAVSFIVFGDWGTGSVMQEMVAGQMEDYCAGESCDFVVTLGDNFYMPVRHLLDAPWFKFYTRVYGRLGLPFYPTLGYHDALGNSVQAQIDRSRIDSTWRMPGEYYSVEWTDSSGIAVLEIFVVNAVNFNGEAREWLESAVGGSSALWKILVTSFPIISNGLHGDDEPKAFGETLPRLCNEIDLILSGQDHLFSHLKGTAYGCPVEQLVIGTGGNSPFTELNENDPRLLATGAFNGFGWFQVSSEKIAFRMIRVGNNDPYYETSWQKN
jgi:hypothetical protein